MWRKYFLCPVTWSFVILARSIYACTRIYKVYTYKYRWAYIFTRCLNTYVAIGNVAILFRFPKHFLHLLSHPLCIEFVIKRKKSPNFSGRSRFLSRTCRGQGEGDNTRALNQVAQSSRTKNEDRSEKY